MIRITMMTLALLMASTTAPYAEDIASLPAALPTDGMELIGAGPFRKFGFHIYDASFWRGADNKQALKIIYQKNIKSSRLIKSTLSEWSKLGRVSEQQAENWASQLESIWPDVSPGQSLVSLVDDSGTRFFNGNGKLLGQIQDPEFGERFLDIWLHPDSSARRLRKKLLQGES